MPDTTDDTATHCPMSQGGGCGPPPPAPTCTADTGAPDDTGVSFQAIEGGGCGCQPSAPPSGALTLSVLLVALLRRTLPLLALWLCPRPAEALDVHLLRTSDGGTFVSLLEADPGPAWTPRAALTLGTATELVNINQNGVVTALVDDVTRADLGVSLPLGDHLRVAATAPAIWRVDYDGIPRGPALGHPTAAVSVHTRGDLQHAWQVDLTSASPTSPAADWLLADPGAIGLTWAVEKRRHDLLLGGNLGGSWRGTTELPGVTVSRQLHYGGAVAWEPDDRVLFSGELFGRTPMATGTGRAGWPAELLLSAGLRDAHGWMLRAGGGMGITKGVGSPNWRALLMLQRTAGAPGDRDGDGIANLRDWCAGRPEDPDGWRDADGCPDLDNDSDGIVDAADACPLDPERLNGHADDDGCPDSLLIAEVTVRLPPGLEDRAAWLQVSGESAPRRIEALHDDPLGVRLHDGSWRLEAGADGLVSAESLLVVGPTMEGTVPLVLQLVRPPTGRLLLRLEDAQHAPVDGRIELAPLDCPRGTAIVHHTGTSQAHTLPACTWELTASAPGHATAHVEVDVIENDHTVTILTLHQHRVTLDGADLHLARSIRFVLDSAALRPEAGPHLDALAGWLHSRPDVELLRIEGRADASGDARHNLLLSRHRAEAVAEALVERGIAAHRLEVLGSGEAHATTATQDHLRAPDRQVGFTLLVWDRRLPAP